MSANDLHVQMCKSGGYWQCHSYHSRHIYSTAIQVVKQWAILVVVCYQPQLSPCSIVCNKFQTYNNDYNVYLKYYLVGTSRILGGSQHFSQCMFTGCDYTHPNTGLGNLCHKPSLYEWGGLFKLVLPKWTCTKYNFLSNFLWLGSAIFPLLIFTSLFLQW